MEVGIQIILSLAHPARVELVWLQTLGPILVNSGLLTQQELFSLIQIHLRLLVGIGKLQAARAFLRLDLVQMFLSFLCRLATAKHEKLVDVDRVDVGVCLVLGDLVATLSSSEDQFLNLTQLHLLH